MKDNFFIFSCFFQYLFTVSFTTKFNGTLAKLVIIATKLLRHNAKKPSFWTVCFAQWMMPLYEDCRRPVLIFSLWVCSRILILVSGAIAVVAARPVPIFTTKSS